MGEMWKSLLQKVYDFEDVHFLRRLRLPDSTLEMDVES